MEYRSAGSLTGEAETGRDQLFTKIGEIFFKNRCNPKQKNQCSHKN